MTREELEAIRIRWEVADQDCADAKFIAHARQDIPALLDALEKAEADNSELKKTLDRARFILM